MITRPLDLASKLRREPRSNDWIFLVNIGLIAVFFQLYASPFVLAPSLGVKFRLPEIAGANDDAHPATHHLNVTDAGQILVPDGVLNNDQLKDWLKKQMDAVRAEKNPSKPVLLVQASVGVQMNVLMQIVGPAREAGFEVRFAAEDPKDAAGRGGR